MDETKKKHIFLCLGILCVVYGLSSFMPCNRFVGRELERKVRIESFYGRELEPKVRIESFNGRILEDNYQNGRRKIEKRLKDEIQRFEKDGNVEFYFENEHNEW